MQSKTLTKQETRCKCGGKLRIVEFKRLKRRKVCVLKCSKCNQKIEI